jgi:hypothetical protein
MKYRMGCIAAVIIILVLATVIMSPGSGLKTGGRAPGIAAYTYVNPSNVVSVTRMGGLPGNKFGVLLAGRDNAKIEKIVGMVNRSTGMRAPTDMEVWSTITWFPVDVVLKLNNDDTVYLQRIMDVTERKMATGEEFTGKNSTDRFMMTLERDNDARHYILYSNEVPEYILKGADADIPSSFLFKRK